MEEVEEAVERCGGRQKGRYWGGENEGECQDAGAGSRLLFFKEWLL